MFSVESIQQLLEPLFPGLMGVRIVELTPERVVGELVVRPNLCTAGNILHGGAYMALADTLLQTWCSPIHHRFPGCLTSQAALYF